MRSLLVAAVLVLATPALAADAPAPSLPAKKSAVTTMHYPTLEKMLRRFSREAGTPRTRG